MAEVVEEDEDERTTEEDKPCKAEGESCNIDSLSRSWPEEEDEIKLRELLPDGKTLRMRRINNISEESDELLPFGLAAEVIESE